MIDSRISEPAVFSALTVAVTFWAVSATVEAVIQAHESRTMRFPLDRVQQTLNQRFARQAAPHHRIHTQRSWRWSRPAEVERMGDGKVEDAWCLNPVENTISLYLGRVRGKA